MSTELVMVRALQLAVPLLTILLVYSIVLAARGDIEKHQKATSVLVIVSLLGVAALVVSIVVFGCDYTNLKDPLLGWGPESIHDRISIHRVFSTPLLAAMLCTTYTGITKKTKIAQVSCDYHNCLLVRNPHHCSTLLLTKKQFSIYCKPDSCTTCKVKCAP